MKTKKTTTCLHRFLGHCPNCGIDYDLNHHPNNYDCPKYQEMRLSGFFAIEPKEDKKDINENI